MGNQKPTWRVKKMSTKERIYPHQTCGVCRSRFRVGGIVVGGRLRCRDCAESWYEHNKIKE